MSDLKYVSSLGYKGVYPCSHQKRNYEYSYFSIIIKHKSITKKLLIFSKIEKMLSLIVLVTIRNTSCLKKLFSLQRRIYKKWNVAKDICTMDQKFAFQQFKLQ